MMVPADEAPMTNGKPYIDRQLAGWGAAMVAKFSLLRSRDASCLTRSRRGTFPRIPVLSSHLPRRRCAGWRYLGLCGERRQLLLFTRGSADGLDDRGVRQGGRVAERLPIGDVT